LEHGNGIPCSSLMHVLLCYCAISSFQLFLI
jgi:hypothetical protein